LQTKDLTKTLSLNWLSQQTSGLLSIIHKWQMQIVCFVAENIAKMKKQVAPLSHACNI
jgi:hypothetical protein